MTSTIASANAQSYLSDVSLPEPEVHSIISMNQVSNLDTKIWTLEEFQQLSSREELDCVATTEFDPALWDCQEVDPRNIRLDEFDCWLENDFSNFDCEDDRRDEWVCDEELQADANLSELLPDVSENNRESGSSSRENSGSSSRENSGGDSSPSSYSTTTASSSIEMNNTSGNSTIHSAAQPSVHSSSTIFFAAITAFAVSMI